MPQQTRNRSQRESNRKLQACPAQTDSDIQDAQRQRYRGSGKEMRAHLPTRISGGTRGIADHLCRHLNVCDTDDALPPSLENYLWGGLRGYPRAGAQVRGEPARNAAFNTADLPLWLATPAHLLERRH